MTIRGTLKETGTIERKEHTTNENIITVRNVSGRDAPAIQQTNKENNPIIIPKVNAVDISSSLLLFINRLIISFSHPFQLV